MTAKNIIRIVLLLFIAGSVSFLIAKEYGIDVFKTDKTPAISSQAEDDADEKTVFFYFHGYRRCPTCHAIERYIKETLDADFAAQLADGSLVWRPTNVEEPQNRHFIRDFGLVSSTAVIAEMNGNSVVRSKKLDLVWKLVRDKVAFMEYVRNEVLNFMAEGGGR